LHVSLSLAPLFLYTLSPLLLLSNVFIYLLISPLASE
jgi:hypothetical protein